MLKIERDRSSFWITYEERRDGKYELNGMSSMKKSARRREQQLHGLTNKSSCWWIFSWRVAAAFKKLEDEANKATSSRRGTTLQ